MVSWQEEKPEGTIVTLGWFARHRSFEAADHAIGIFCLLLANENGRPHGGAVVNELGVPATSDMIARQLNVTAAAVDAAIDRFCAVETMRRTESGLVVVPNLKIYNPSKEAARKRRQRSVARPRVAQLDLALPKEARGTLDGTQSGTETGTETGTTCPASCPDPCPKEAKQEHPPNGTSGALTTTLLPTTRDARDGLWFSLNDGTAWHLDAEEIRRFARRYPDTDVHAELELIAEKTVRGTFTMTRHPEQRMKALENCLKRPYRPQSNPGLRGPTITEPPARRPLPVPGHHPQICQCAVCVRARAWKGNGNAL